MIDPAVLARIGWHAERQGLDPILVQAIVEHESGGDPFVSRYEPHWRYLLSPRDYASRLGITGATEEMLQSMSWGLMQIMGSVARELGYDSHLVRLTDVELGLYWGCKKLKLLSRQYGEESDWIAAYNMGSPRKTPGGLYQNQKTYVDPIAARLRELRKLS